MKKKKAHGMNREPRPIGEILARRSVADPGGTSRKNETAEAATASAIKEAPRVITTQTSVAL